MFPMVEPALLRPRDRASRRFVVCSKCLREHVTMCQRGQLCSWGYAKICSSIPKKRQKSSTKTVGDELYTQTLRLSHNRTMLLLGMAFVQWEILSLDLPPCHISIAPDSIIISNGYPGLSRSIVWNQPTRIHPPISSINDVGFRLQ